jgi:hypothetical protein
VTLYRAKYGFLEIEKPTSKKREWDVYAPRCSRHDRVFSSFRALQCRNCKHGGCEKVRVREIPFVKKEKE